MSRTETRSLSITGASAAKAVTAQTHAKGRIVFSTLSILPQPQANMLESRRRGDLHATFCALYSGRCGTGTGAHGASASPPPSESIPEIRWDDERTDDRSHFPHIERDLLRVAQLREDPQRLGGSPHQCADAGRIGQPLDGVESSQGFGSMDEGREPALGRGEQGFQVRESQ